MKISLLFVLLAVLSCRTPAQRTTPGADTRTINPETIVLQDRALGRTLRVPHRAGRWELPEQTAAYLSLVGADVAKGIERVENISIEFVDNYAGGTLIGFGVLQGGRRVPIGVEYKTNPAQQPAGNTVYLVADAKHGCFNYGCGCCTFLRDGVAIIGCGCEPTCKDSIGLCNHTVQATTGQ
jgi:hypothetical protein